MQDIYEQDIERVVQGQETNGSIFIGNVDAAKNINTLRRYNIKSVITIAKGYFLNHSERDLPNYLYIPANDDKNFQISKYFKNTFQFIERNIKKSNILVHCKAGVSRSVTIVIAYLMKKQSKTMKQAYQMVYKMRPIIDPNEGFIQQLRDYQKQVKQNDSNFQNKHKNTSRKQLSVKSLCPMTKQKLNQTPKVLKLQKPQRQIPINEQKISPINLEEKIRLLRQKYRGIDNTNDILLARKKSQRSQNINISKKVIDPAVQSNKTLIQLHEKIQSRSSNKYLKTKGRELIN